LNTTPPDAPAAPTSKRPLSLGVIFLTLYIDLVGFSIIFPLFPSMLEHYLGKEGNTGLLGAVLGGIHQLSSWIGGGERYTAVLFGGFLGSLYSLLQFLCAPLWGGLSDRIGRRRILIMTCAGTMLSYLLWVFSGSFLLLVLARLFGGAMSGNLSVATAAVADVTSREGRAKGMGMVGAAFGLGFVTGPAIGGIFAHINLLESHPGWEAFGINPFSVPALFAFALSTLNVVWIWARFRETLPESARAKAAPLRERSPWRTLHTRINTTVNRTIFVHFVFIFAFSGMEFSLAFLAADRFGFSTAQITILMIYVGVVLILTQGGIVRRIVPKFGERRVALAGLVLVTFGFFTMGFANSVVWLYLGLGAMALGSGCVTPSLTAMVSLFTSPEQQGQALGVFRAFGALGRALGPICAALSYWVFGSRVSYSVGALLMILPIIAALRLPSPHKHE
jgi:MFS family permease